MRGIKQDASNKGTGVDEAKIGRRLYELRQRRGISQRELARRAGLTHGTISFIERDKISPSIGTMRQVLDVLGLTLSEFFSPDVEPTPRYFFERHDLIEVGSGGVSLLQVGRSLVGRPLQVLLETYMPGSETSRDPYRVDGGEEGGIVIEGEIEATIGNDIRVLRRFGAYLFPTSLPHKLRNISDRPCILVSATTPPV